MCKIKFFHSFIRSFDDKSPFLFLVYMHKKINVYNDLEESVCITLRISFLSSFTLFFVLTFPFWSTDKVHELASNEHESQSRN